MSRHPRPTRTSLLRSTQALTVVALITGLAACGGGSSGGGKSASPATTLAAALQLQQQGKIDEAKQLYLQVVKAQPNNYFAQYDLGVIAQQDRDNAAALTYYGAALTAKPNYVPALYNEGTIYAVTDPTLAISTYRKVLTIQPVAPTAALNLGLLEIKHGQPKAGVRDLALAVKQDPSLMAQIPKQLRVLVTAVAPTPQTSTTATPTGTPTTSTSP